MSNFFIIKKNNVEFHNHSFSNIALNLCKSLLFTFMLTGVIILIIIYPIDYFIVNILHFESIKGLINERQNQVEGLYPPYLIVFIGPLIEEILFRLALNLNRINFSIFLGMLFYKLIGGQIVEFDIHNSFYLCCVVASITILIMSYIFFPLKAIVFLNERKNKLIIISIFLFGLMHISTIGILHWQLALFYPFYVLSQIIAGYFITNLRLKYGFFWGLLLHILINAFTVLVR